MKKKMACLLGVFLLVLQPVWAEDFSIGQVVGVQGKVTSRNAEGDVRELHLKSAIYQNDVITTGPDTRLQIMFNDDTLFAQGENSEMVIDEYVFDPVAPEENRFGVNLFKGIFRVITGKITELNPERFKVKTGRAKIGIRGCELGFEMRPDKDVVYVMRLPKGKTITVEPAAGAGAKQGLFSRRGAIQMVQPGVVTVRDYGRLKQRSLLPDDVHVISGQTTPKQPVRPKRQQGAPGQDPGDDYVEYKPAHGHRVNAADYRLPPGTHMNVPINPGSTILQESEPYALNQVEPEPPPRRPDAGGDKPPINPPGPEPKPPKPAPPPPPPSGSWAYKGFGMASTHPPLTKEPVLTPPRIYTSADPSDVAVQLNKDEGRVGIHIDLEDTEGNVYQLGDPTATIYQGGDNFLVRYNTEDEEIVLVNKEGGEDWTWGEWNGLQDMDPAAGDATQDDRERVNGEYVVGRVLSGGEVDRIAQMSSVHTLTGQGQASAVFSDMYNAPLARMNGTANLAVRIGGGHQEWGGTYHLNGGGCQLNMEVRDGTPIVNGRLAGIPSDYNLNVNGTRVYGRGQVIDAGMDGRLVGSPNRITGAIGNGFVRHSDYTRVDLLYGTDLK